MAFQQADTHVHVVLGVQQDPDLCRHCRPEPAEDPLQDLPVGSAAFQAPEGGHDVGDGIFDQARKLPWSACTSA